MTSQDNAKPYFLGICAATTYLNFTTNSCAIRLVSTDHHQFWRFCSVLLCQTTTQYEMYDNECTKCLFL